VQTLCDTNSSVAPSFALRAGGKNGSRWSRRWALFTSGMSPWSRKRAARPTASSRRFSSIRCNSARARISTAIRGRRRRTRGARSRRLRPVVDTDDRADLPGRPFDDGLRVGPDRALGRRGAARPFRRSRDSGRQAVQRGPAGHRGVRREGFPAAGGDPADRHRPQSGHRDHRRSNGSRRGRARSVLAQRLSVRRRARPRRCLPDALRSRRRRNRIREPVEAALAEARALADAGFARIDYVALVDAATLEPLDRARRARCG
jgi:hypothetical protein